MTEPVIWFKKDLRLEELGAEMMQGTLGGHLGMRWSRLGPNFLEATMPVDERTRQPYGLLHGGASVALAETIGSVASAMVVDHSRFMCVGMEINANHVRSAREGLVTGVARPIHLGASSHVWDIRITDAQGKLVCVSRLTVAILPRRK